LVWTAFFARVNPVSISAKPSCMNITKKAQTSSQARFNACSVISTSPARAFAARHCRWLGVVPRTRSRRGPDEKPEPADDEQEDDRRQGAARHSKQTEKRPVAALRAIPRNDLRRVFEVGEHLRGRRVALPGRPIDRAKNDLFDVGVDVGQDLAR